MVAYWMEDNILQTKENPSGIPEGFVFYIWSSKVGFCT